MNDWKPTHRIQTNTGRTIAVQLVDGALYDRSEWDSSSAADFELDASGTLLHLGGTIPWATISKIADGDAGISYRVAFTKESGDFDYVETFTADDDDAANAYAEQHYAGQEWYVIDDAGRNINGGIDG